MVEQKIEVDAKETIIEEKAEEPKVEEKAPEVAPPKVEAKSEFPSKLFFSRMCRLCSWYTFTECNMFHPIH